MGSDAYQRTIQPRPIVSKVAYTFGGKTNVSYSKEMEKFLSKDIPADIKIMTLTSKKQNNLNLMRPPAIKQRPNSVSMYEHQPTKLKVIFHNEVDENGV